MIIYGHFVFEIKINLNVVLQHAASTHDGFGKKIFFQSKATILIF